MPIEELCVGTFTHRVQPQQDLTQDLLGVELMDSITIVLILRLDEVIEVGEGGIAFRPHSAEVSPVCDAPFLIQLREHDLDGIDMSVAEILVGTKEILEKGDVLCQQCVFPKGFRRGLIFRLAAVIPALGFQYIDDVLSGHEVGKAAAHSFAHFPLLMLGIQRNDGFP